MKMGKKITSIITIMLVIASLLTACGSNEKNNITSNTDFSKETGKEDTTANISMNIAVLKGPTGMGMVKLMEDSTNGVASNQYQFTVSSDASVVTSKLIAGDYDIAALPTNSAAVLYGKTEGNVQMLAINTYGNLYLIQNTVQENAIASVSDIKGKTVTMFGQGANPEYVMSYILEQNHLVVGQDVILDFKGTVDEVLTAVAAGDCEFALLPEPNTTVALSKNPNYTKVINMSEEWNKTSKDSKLVMGCIVARKDFIEQNKESVDAFIKEYSESIQYVLDHEEEAANLIEKHEIVGAAAVAKKALPGSNLTFISGKDIQEMVEGYYQVLHSYNPSAVGGSIPDEKFYYIAE